MLLLSASGVAAVLLVPLLVRHLPDLHRRREFIVRPGEIRITPRPEWVSPNLVNEVCRRAGLPEEMSLLDPDLTRRVAQAFLDHPWVAGVRIRKDMSAGLIADVQYRRPAAMVETRAGLYPVDADGVLLPPNDFTPAEARRYPLIRSVASMPAGPAGQPWGDPALLAAARLAAFLAPHWERFGLTAIVVPGTTADSPRADDVPLSLTTRGGSQIVWGRGPGTEHPGELSEQQKLGRLEDYLTRYGSFDSGHGPFEIDIRHWREISRRPLAAGDATPRN